MPRAIASTRRIIIPSATAMPVISSVSAFLGGKRAELRGPSAVAHPTRDIHHSAVANPAKHAPNQQMMDVIATPSPPKTLLLEGDAFHVSNDGISRTYYELKSWTKSEHSTMPVSLEERYDLKHARKTFIVRRDYPDRDSSRKSQNNKLGKSAQGVASLGSPLSAFELQEIDQGVLGSAGTGATTWESSIAMSLFFSSNPWLLRGDVVELGSGVGLAGLLGQLAPTALSEMKSLTLTDMSTEVLEQCQRNLDQASLSTLPTQVEKLDWYDFVRNKKEGESARKYDTVLASDCAYLYPDVVALASAMSSLCRNHERSRIHVFGPYNRGALHELVHQLKDDCKMKVDLDWIEMNRFRLKPQRDVASSHLSEDECPFASKNTAKFLHITAWQKDSCSSQGGRGRVTGFGSLFDID